MNRHPIPAVVITCAVSLATAGAAMAAGAATAWPGTAPLAGQWSGTAASTAMRGLTFPVVATVAVSASGRPHGTVHLGAPVDCAGGWVPIRTRGAVTTFAETTPAGVGTECIAGGTTRLSPASGGRLRYVWSKGDAGSVAYLSPQGISGHWTGTIRQADLGPITARIRVVGVRAGQMNGRSEYGAPLSCDGTLVPLGRGTQQRAVFDEKIIHSRSTVCVGSGTTTLTLRADGRLAYRWTGAGEVSTGVLWRAG